MNKRGVLRMVISVCPYIEQRENKYVTDDGFETEDFGQALQHAWDSE